MAIRGFEIISVPVSDQQRAKRFYTEVLGFGLVRESPMSPGMSWIQLAPPGQSVTIALVTWFETMKPGGLQGVMVNTDDIAAEHQTLRSRGLEISDIKEEPWGRYALFSDPDGNGWILRQPPAGA
jgi:catechol 2,3-dioxygenase-like lactoylglutathione lyase family enzyme